MKFGIRQRKISESHADDHGNVYRRKPEVDFQYGGRLFSENGNTNVSAAD